MGLPFATPRQELLRRIGGDPPPPAGLRVRIEISVDETRRVLDRELLAMGIAIAEGVDFRDAGPMARPPPQSSPPLTATLGV